MIEQNNRERLFISAILVESIISKITSFERILLLDFEGNS